MKQVVLTFDDATVSQYEVAVPLLRKYGFGATFFICRFNDAWRAEHAQYLLDSSRIREISDMGFEIGNHTWNHELPPGKCEEEIDSLTDFLVSAGIPEPRTFAYPGGPFNAEAAEILRRKGYLSARTTEHAAWNLKTQDPMRVPAIPVQGSGEELFLKALGYADGENPPVLVFHGVPDPVHAWVDTPEETFRKDMEYLAENGWEVLGMGDYVKRSKGR